MESSSVESPPSINRKRPTSAIMLERKTSAGDSSSRTGGRSKGLMWWMELRDVEVSSAGRFGQVFVFPFWVYYYHFRVKHQTSQHFQFSGVRLSRTGLGENDGIIIFQRKPVKKHQAVVVAVDAVKNPLCPKTSQKKRTETSWRWEMS